MSKFRKSLPDYDSFSSGSENEEYVEDRDLSPPPAKRQRKRQTKPPKKLSEYETEGAVGITEEELRWCIIEWDGENSYDCINKDKISAFDGDLVFQPGEKVFANFKGKPFKATIAVVAVTKSDAENSYKENRQPKKTAKKTKSVESNAKSSKKDNQKRTEKEKEPEKKKSQAQEDREFKANREKAQREQMKEVLRESQEINCQLIEDVPDDKKTPITPRHTSSPKVVAVPKIKPCKVTAIEVADDSKETCCQQCSLNKAAIQRNSQALQILQQGISALQSEIEHLKKQESSQPSTLLLATPKSAAMKSKSTSNSCLPSSMLSCSIDNSTSESGDDSGDLPVRSPENQKVVLPHHLKSKAAGANSLKKAARILAVGFFTVKERCSCTVTGSSNKTKEDTKRPQFDTYRMSLIHEFLQKTYPKSYQHGDVNRIIGQVAIESRQGCHATDDSVVLSLLQ